MKTIYLTFSFVIIFFISCENQSDNNNSSPESVDTLWLHYEGYIPFPEKKAEWYTENSKSIYYNGVQNNNQPPDEIINYSNKYYFSGDTILNELVYKKINRQYHYLHYDFDPDNMPGNLINEGDSNIFFGSFRQDIEKKMVFIIYANATKEEILYDFNLAEGDTLKNISNDSLFYTLYCIDSVKLIDRYHHIYYYALSDGRSSSTVINSEIILEGIGYYLGSPFSRDGGLVEFKYNDNVIEIPSDMGSPKCK